MRIVFLVWFAGAVWAQQAMSPEAADLVRRAVSLQQAGDYAGAADAYRSVLRLQPNDVATHVNLGVVLAKLNRFDQAIAEYNAADQLLPGDPRIGLNIALAYQKSGRLREAAGRLEDVHAKMPGNRQATLLLADSYLQLGQDAQVIELLRPIARESEEDMAVSYLLGMADLRSGNNEEGQMMLDRILKRGDSAEAHYLLGTRMFESQDYPAAVRELAAAVKLNPNLPQLQSLYGRALLNTGDPDAAAQAFYAELAQHPDDFEANASLGAILAERNQCGPAIPLLTRALTTRNDAGDPQLALAKCLLHTGRLAEALPHAEQAAAVLPQSAEAHELLASVAARLHHTDVSSREHQMAEQLRRAAQESPRVGDLSPDFTLPSAGTGEPLRVSSFRGKSPVVLVFGSYSCPNLRSSAQALRSAYDRYHARAAFVLVYIREAHADQQWESTRNQREGVIAREATSDSERAQSAMACSRRLHLPFPAVTDTLDGKVETAYHAWPSRALVIDKQGRVNYSTRLTELDFDRQDFERALEAVSR